MGRLDGKVAIITGAGRGIGKAMARRFVAEGAKVAVTSFTQENIDALVKDLTDAHGEGCAIGIRCDVSEEADIKAAVAQTVDAFGTIDIAVNNAFELSTAARKVMETETADFHRQMITGPLAAYNQYAEHLVLSYFPYPH